MSRGFNYFNGNRRNRVSNKGKSNQYEFIFEVYVRPYFGSGYVPVGKGLTSFQCESAHDVVNNVGYSGFLSFNPIGGALMHVM